MLTCISGVGPILKYKSKNHSWESTPTSVAPHWWPGWQRVGIFPQQISLKYSFKKLPCQQKCWKNLEQKFFSVFSAVNSLKFLRFFSGPRQNFQQICWKFFKITRLTKHNPNKSVEWNVIKMTFFSTFFHMTYNNLSFQFSSIFQQFFLFYYILF